MSVMMGMRLTVDPELFMQVIERKAEQAKAIAERGRSKGAVHHMFLAGESEVLVADEWDSEESFQAFFQEAGAEIGEPLAEAGVSNEPQPVFWRPLNTADRF